MKNLDEIEFKAKVFGKIAEFEQWLKEISSPELLNSVRGRLAETDRILQNKQKLIAKNQQVVIESR